MFTEGEHGNEAGLAGTAEAGLKDEWLAWRAARLSSVNAPDGPAALTRTVWLDDHPELVFGIPGRWSREGDAVRVQLAASETAEIDGHPRAGSFLAEPVSETNRTHLSFPGTTVEVTRRAGLLGLRLFDHDRAGSVERIDAFAPSPCWRVEGDFAALPAGTSQAYDFAVGGSTRDLEAPGVVSLALGGSVYETMPFRDGDKLVLVFSDATTGTETKGPCRFVELDAPPLAENGRVVVDFNRAYLPPCAFSDEFNCPLPPRGHRFATPITAGEIDVTWKSVVVSAG